MTITQDQKKRVSYYIERDVGMTSNDVNTNGQRTRTQLTHDGNQRFNDDKIRAV